MMWISNQRLLSTAASGLRLAIVGSGPSGFYTAKYAFRYLPVDHVHMIEYLPMPYGLVRYGVAPDHQDVKSVSREFSQIACDSRFDFVGNCRLGKDVTVDDLRRAHHAVVLCHGASESRRLLIPGEDSPAVIPAADFVKWYNGYPVDADFFPPRIPKDIGKVVIIGNGNVALDCARILCKAKLDHLSETDIDPLALGQLKKSSLREILIVGRRGPVQSSFTIKELRELSKIPRVRLVADIRDYQNAETPATLAELSASRAKKRLWELWKMISRDDGSKEDEITIRFRFLLSPASFHLNEQKIVFNKTLLKTVCAYFKGEQGRQRAVKTDEMEEVPCDMALVSVGYKVPPIDGVPMSEGRILNRRGRIEAVSGLYCSGWGKRGPNGIIGTNIADAKETIQSISDDLNSGLLKSPVEWSSLHDRAGHFVSWNDVMEVDEYETSLGQAHGAVRRKLNTVEKVLTFLNKRKKEL